MQVSGFGFRVSGSGFRVSGVEFRVSGFEFQVSAFCCRFSGFGFRVSGFGFARLRESVPRQESGRGCLCAIFAQLKKCNAVEGERPTRSHGPTRGKCSLPGKMEGSWAVYMVGCIYLGVVYVRVGRLYCLFRVVYLG